MLDPEVSALARGLNYAHLATLMADGSPHSAAVWIDAAGDRLLVYKEEGSLALANVRRDPRVAISLVELGDPYRGFRVRGEVVEIRGEPDAVRWLDARAVEYTGERYPEDRLPAGGGVLLAIRPDRATAYSSTASFRHRAG